MSKARKDRVFDSHEIVLKNTNAHQPEGTMTNFRSKQDLIKRIVTNIITDA